MPASSASACGRLFPRPSARRAYKHACRRACMRPLRVRHAGAPAPLSLQPGSAGAHTKAGPRICAAPYYWPRFAPALESRPPGPPRLFRPALALPARPGLSGSHWPPGPPRLFRPAPASRPALALPARPGLSRPPRLYRPAPASRPAPALLARTGRPARTGLTDPHWPFRSAPVFPARSGLPVCTGPLFRGQWSIVSGLSAALMSCTVMWNRFLLMSA